MRLLSKTRSALECKSFGRKRLCEVDRRKASNRVEEVLRGSLLIGVWRKCVPLTYGAKLMVVTWEIKNTNAVCVPTHERFKVVIPFQHSSLTTAYSSYSPLTFFSTRRCLCRCILPVCFRGLFLRVCVCECVYSMIKSKVRQDREARRKREGTRLKLWSIDSIKHKRENSRARDGCKNFPEVCQRQQNLFLFMRNSEGCCLISICKLNKEPSWTTRETREWAFFPQGLYDGPETHICER